MKIKKRIFTIIVCLLLTFNITANSYSVVYASGFEGAILGGGGAAVLSMTAPEVVITVGLLFGIAVGANYVVENWDSIEATISAGVSNFGEWMAKAKTGIIDTTSNAFKNIKNWCFNNLGPLEGIVNPSGLTGYYILNGSYQAKYDSTVGNFDRIEIPQGVISVYHRSYSNSSGQYSYGLVFVSEEAFRIGSYSISTGRTTYNTSSSRNIYRNGVRHTYYYLSTGFTQAVTSLYYPFLLNKNYVDISGNVQAVSEIIYDNYFLGGYNIAGGVNTEFGHISDNVTVTDNTTVISTEGDPTIVLPRDWDTDNIIDGVTDGTIAYEDVLDIGNVVPVEIVNDEYMPITPDGVSSAPYEPDERPNGAFVISGLERLFPFCIPFDIYNTFAVLAAEPEAPNFTWELYVLGQSYPIEIDLSDYDSVAEILRSMLIILFIIGLALKTRDLIRG